MIPARDDMGRPIHGQYVPALCQKFPMRGKKRCRLHGGRSIGPITPEGMARTLSAMQAGRLRWLAKLKAAGQPIPCGRKKGGHNLPKEEREQRDYEERCFRFAREDRRQMAIERKARRQREHEEREEDRRRAADHARRQALIEASLPRWMREEWEKL
jgi:hypothetical protein